jgi:hypothetical protein
VNDVVFTFTPGVATQTGSNDACSLRQITWSINEKIGVSAGMEMTRKYRIGPWFEIMMSVDADLRSGRRLETGRRSESIIYIIVSSRWPA